MSTRPTPLEEDVTDAMTEVQELVQRATPESLLKAFASLTHRMHAARDSNPNLELRLRMERELLEAELLRRLRSAPAPG